MKKQSLFQQTAVLSGANTVVRALGFAMRVWLSRMMGPEALGIMELASSAHMLWIAPVTSGIPMAVAREAAAGHGEEALRAGRRLALTISFWMLPFLLLLSPVIAQILGDARTMPALLLYALCLPILGHSAAYGGYCYGAGNTIPPSVSELVEQIVRFGICIGVLTLVSGMTAAWTAAVPPLATLIGEAISAAVVVLMLRHTGIKLKGSASKELRKKLLQLAMPMTWMRITNTLMRSINAVLIPMRLRASGLSAQEATARLGMLSGMAMPLVMLPSVITGALAMVSGPALARHQGNPKALLRLLMKVLPIALLVSVVSAALLVVGAPLISTRLFRQPDLAPLLTVIAPLVPIMGVQQVLSGMLAGLGKQRSALTGSLVGALITLGLNYSLVADYRLIGCAWAQIAGQSVSLTLHLRILIQSIRCGT